MHSGIGGGGVADIGLTYEPDPTDPHAASDSDWALRKSTSGWDIMWRRALINWGSKGQPVIALSSCEAEIIAASVAAKDTISIHNLITELSASPLPAPHHKPPTTRLPATSLTTLSTTSAPSTFIAAISGFASLSNTAP